MKAMLVLASVVLAAVILTSVILAAALCAGLASAVDALEYVDSSPVGAQFPSWDGGDTGLCFADINEDGNVDFVSIGDHGSPYVNTQEHGIMSYFGDGAGGWSIFMSGNFGYGGIGVGDVNNDGHWDVGYGMHHNYSGVDFGDQLIEVALGNGTGMQWVPADDGLATNGESWGMFATDFADFDHDGDLDLASNSFGCCNGVHVYRNNYDGTWTQTFARTGDNSHSQLCMGDVNGDGHPDIAASYQHGFIWLGDGAGGFVQADTGLPGWTGVSGVSLGDVDDDGCADLSIACSGGVRVYVWRTDHWELSADGLPTSGGYEITLLRDMNSDGELDLAALGDGTFSVWLGDGTGHWTAGGSFYHGPATSAAAMDAGGDVDHNGYPDVVLVQEEGTYPSYRNHLHVYRETSTPAERFVIVQSPRISENLIMGSVHAIRWTAAHFGTEPATISIALSRTGPEGPWSPLASGLPDGSAYQWITPGPPASAACIRVTLQQGGEIAVAYSRPFRITPADPAAAPALPEIRDLAVRIAPNPARERVTFALDRTAIAANSAAEIAVLDIGGRIIALLPLPASAGTVSWNTRDSAGSLVPAGIYLARPREGGAGARFTILR